MAKRRRRKNAAVSRLQENEPQRPRIGRRLAPTKQEIVEGEVAIDISNIFGTMSPFGLLPGEDELIRKHGVEIYRKMEDRDAQIRQALSLKKQAVISTKLNVRPMETQDDDENVTDEARRQADFIEEVLERIQGSLRTSLLKILNCFRDGYSVTEKIHNVIPDGQFQGMIGIHALKTHKAEGFRFIADQHGNLQGIIQTSGLISGQELPIGKFVIVSYNKNADDANDLYGRSDLRPAWRYYRADDIIDRYWNVFLEKYAMPMAYGKIKRTKRVADEKSRLLTLLKNLQADSAAIIPDDMEINLLESTRRAGATYKERLDYCNKMKMRAILGGGDLATQQSEGSSGSFAMSKIHFDVLILQLGYIQEFLQDEILGEQLVVPLIDMNFANPMYPRLQFESLIQDDQKAKAEMLARLVDVGLVNTKEEWIREELRLPEKPEEIKAEEDENRDRMRSLGKGGSPIPPKADKDGKEEGDGGDDKDEGEKEKFQISRSKTPYEQKVGFAAVERTLNDAQMDAISDLADVIREVGDAYIATVNSMRIIEDQKPNAIRDIKIRKVGKVKDVVLDWLQRILKRGSRDAKTELGKVKLIQEKVNLARIRPSVEGAVLQRLLRANAFHIAGVLSDDILKRANQILVSGLDNGWSNRKVMSDLESLFVEFTGDPGVLGPDGKVLEASRLETIVRTNFTSAYNRGRLDTLLDPDLEDFVKGVQYSAILDARTCFAKGTPVYCADGVYRAIDKIEPGTFVISGSGNRRKILGTKTAITNEWRKLKFSDGTKIQSTPTHPFWTFRNNGYQWVEAKDLSPGDEIGTGQMPRMRKANSALCSDAGTEEVLFPEVLERESNSGLASERLSVLQKAIQGQKNLCRQGQECGKDLFSVLQGYVEASRSSAGSHAFQLRNLREGFYGSTSGDSAWLSIETLLEEMPTSTRKISLPNVRTNIRQANQLQSSSLLPSVLSGVGRRNQARKNNTPRIGEGRDSVRARSEIEKSEETLFSGGFCNRGSNRSGSRWSLLAFKPESERAGYSESQSNPEAWMETGSGNSNQGHDCSVNPLAAGSRKIIEIEILHESGICYDLEIERDHSYLVSNGIIVHNTEICKHLDGRVFPTTDTEGLERHKPPRHHNCRSILVPVTVPDVKKKPFTPITEAQKARAVALTPKGFS